VRAARAIAALVLALGAVGPAAACVNETGTNRFGRAVYVELGPSELRPILTHGGREREMVEWATRVTRQAREQPGFDNHNQLAVALIRLGRPREAIELLLVLEERYPGRYPTATNLGTAYELAGEDAKALEWIREGIVRNPVSHDGSEWLHARILEAKVDGTAARGGSLLGLDFGDEPMAQAPSRMPVGNDRAPIDAAALSWHLFVQLAERTQFVPPADPVVASLFFDWASNEMASGALETADVAYDFALAYGHPRRALIQARRNEIARILEERRRTS
jgi:tetratricopeptide (TPR) repeat protein